MTGPPPQDFFVGRNVLVTGAGRGIGRVIAARFLALGANVVGVEIDPVASDELKRDIGGRGSGLALVVGDAGRAETAERAVKTCLNRFGPPQVVVNNVGRAFHGRVEDMTTGEWEDALRVNLSSAFFFCRAAVPHLKTVGGGSIVNISSISGLRGNAGMAPYNAAKFGLIGLTKGLAAELGSFGIRVNAVCPGDVDTEMLASFVQWLAERQGLTAGQIMDRMAAETPLGRPASPEEIAEVVVFLASPAASYVTGACLPVTGGKYGL